MLSKRFYEPLPYLYISLALAVVTLFEHGVVYLFAAILYVSGAAVWVMRSNHRRKNSSLPRAAARLRMPRLVYEYLPFVYLGAGVGIMTQLTAPWNFLSGTLLALAGVLVWLIRAIYRNQVHFDLPGSTRI